MSDVTECLWYTEIPEGVISEVEVGEFKFRIVGFGIKRADQFKPHNLNWRKHPQRQRFAVHGSLASLGWVDVCLENRRSGNLIDGHERVWQGLKNNEYIPFIHVDLNDAEEAQALLSLDAIAALAETDRDNVAALLEQVQTDNADVMEFLTDFAADSGLDWNAPEEKDAEPQIDRAAELQKLWGTETGQLWKLGDHRLLVGDCTVRENVERLMGGEKAELCFTDPPYGVGMNIENDDLKGLEFDTFNADWIKQIPLGNNCGFVCYHSTRTFPSVLRIAVESGWEFERMLWYYVPDKFPAHSWKHWMMVSQAIMLFSFGDVLYADTQSDQDCYKMTSADLGVSNGHPTEKRAENCQRVMSHYGGVNVYEPFAGSGTTIIAAHNLGRRCYAMEISPAYSAVILQRFADATGIQPELIDPN